ncbi:hypothetical protein CRUP_020076 [Coryphaenoides rupestris]|nr:hypothetical protein CRUP_020076 [Coryphaenoides rupestris]
MLAASIPFLACELKAVRPHRTGFICGDPSIAYPYFHQEAVSDTLLISGGILITALTIGVGECYRVRFLGISSRAFVRNLYVSRLYKELGGFLFGCFVGQSLTNVAKLSVGRLRPHFLKSFFSGHASFAMYTGLYLAFYLQARLRWRGARLLRPALQSFLLLLAVFTGLTRVSDHRHHPSDVLAGYAQGALTAYWVAFHVSSMFKSSSQVLSSAVSPPLSLSTC